MTNLEEMKKIFDDKQVEHIEKSWFLVDNEFIVKNSPNWTPKKIIGDKVEYKAKVVKNQGKPTEITKYYTKQFTAKISSFIEAKGDNLHIASMIYNTVEEPMIDWANSTRESLKNPQVAYESTLEKVVNKIKNEINISTKKKLEMPEDIRAKLEQELN